MRRGRPAQFQRAFAIPLVLFLMVVAMIFGGSLFRQGTTINLVNARVYQGKYLEWLNRGILEMVKYKLKILPSEFYLAHQEYVEAGGNLVNSPLMQRFLLDFNDPLKPQMKTLDPDTALGQPDTTTVLDFIETPKKLVLELRSLKDSELYKEDIYHVRFQTTFRNFSSESNNVVYLKRTSD